ncbi:MAG: methyltransferase domain-containing protein [Chloroflexota bacterium]|nr:MAG: methyltransferase domain-containing protein [Chloroflexota bacterium]
MDTHRVDYDQMAGTFDHRYPPGKVSDSGLALQKLVADVNGKRILEVGSGTGHWLEFLNAPDRFLVGLDYSRGMLSNAQIKGVSADLVQGDAGQLPVKPGEFNFVYCVHALHHFASPESFIVEAQRMLYSGGVLAILGSDFPANRENWYIYEYFEGVYETDINRFPPWKDVVGWMVKDGFELIELDEVEHILDYKKGADVLRDPYLQKHACSQLALLSDGAYQEGMSKIESDLVQAEEDGRQIVFKSEIAIMMLSGRKAQ